MIRRSQRWLVAGALTGVAPLLVACASPSTPSVTPPSLADAWVEQGKSILGRETQDPAQRLENERAANKLFQEAAEANNLGGAYELCVSYQSGRGGIEDTVDNLKQAQHWCKISAAAGNQDAKLRYDEATKLLRGKQMWVTYYLGIPWSEPEPYHFDPFDVLFCLPAAGRACW